MSDWQEGDLVEAVKGETRIVARLEARDGGLFFFGWGEGTLSVEYQGYAMTLLERAVPKVELPTEPGFYADKDGDVWTLLTANEDHNQRWFYGSSYMLASEVIASGPFIRLEPVAGTARKVLDAVRARVTLHCETDARRLDGIAAEFGARD